MTAVDTTEFPKLPKGYRWKVRYRPDGLMRILDKAEVYIKRGMFTVTCAGTFLEEHDRDFRAAALWCAHRAWKKWQAPSIPDLAKAIEAELNSGVLR